LTSLIDVSNLCFFSELRAGDALPSRHSTFVSLRWLRFPPLSLAEKLRVSANSFQEKLRPVNSHIMPHFLTWFNAPSEILTGFAQQVTE